MLRHGMAMSIYPHRTFAHAAFHTAGNDKSDLCSYGWHYVRRTSVCFPCQNCQRDISLKTACDTRCFVCFQGHLEPFIRGCTTRSSSPFIALFFGIQGPCASMAELLPS